MLPARGACATPKIILKGASVASPMGAAGRGYDAPFDGEPLDAQVFQNGPKLSWATTLLGSIRRPVLRQPFRTDKPSASIPRGSASVLGGGEPLTRMPSS